ncbi:MAG: FAD-binding protein [Anaerolineales bacterium]|nr:FAD-binding protein [Anaerolineales bacterium]
MRKTLLSQPSKAFQEDLQRALSDVHFDNMTRLLYSTDASIYQKMPLGVALPLNTAEVEAALKTAISHTAPVLARGGGSSLAGQAVGHALILDFSRYMDQILEINPEQRTVRVQPGITLTSLNQSLKPYGLMYGPDPASGDRATMGGILGNNATGSHSIRYGLTSDHVIAVKALLSDGSTVVFDSFSPGDWTQRMQRPGLEGSIYTSVRRILTDSNQAIKQHTPRTFRHVAGYNLHRLVETDRPNLALLLAGSEGTLGIATEITLSLVPVPAVKRLLLIHYSSLHSALESVPALLETGPAAVELIDKMLLDLARGNPDFAHRMGFIQGDPEAVLILELAGESNLELDAAQARVFSLLQAHRQTEPVIVLDNPAQQAEVWAVRTAGLGIIMSVRGDSKPIPFIEDAAVPVEHLSNYISELTGFAHSVGVNTIAVYAHASAGCLHVRPMINLKTVDGLRQMRQIAEKSVELVSSFGGTTSGEHGEGQSRGEFSEKLFGPELSRAYKELKNAFDPETVFNPGKVVNAPPMDDAESLRYGPDYAVPYEITNTIFDFSDNFGFAGAVEMCNGAGVCRQLDLGTMCPSFQATRDETHSTRGRANALRAAMMGLLGPEAMTSRELFKVMDLCLSCHACKSECPSSVDMAKVKAEFLHNYYQEHGVPLRSRLFANIAIFNRLGQPFAPLTNLILRGPVRAAMQLIGVHPARSMPVLAKQSFSRWFRNQSPQSRKDSEPEKKLIFFHDTFMEHNDPDVGKAAIRILESAGYQPIILKERKCCGRPAVSKGLLDEAKKLAVHNIHLLAPYAYRGIPIVGCEPSCMAMLVDEYEDLVPGPDSQVIARHSMMIDRFIVEEVEAGRLKLALQNHPRKILFHGHCQQKSTFGTEYTHRMLKLIPNCEVEEVQAGCCGMAGSFGYEKEHYDLSIQIAEMALAPAVRAAPTDTIICAIGTSCREQIQHTTGRTALHPIQILAEALIS